MGGCGVGEVGTGASEPVDGMVNGTSLTMGPIAGASEDCKIMGAETGVNIEFVEIEGFAENDREVWRENPGLMDMRRGCGKIRLRLWRPG